MNRRRSISVVARQAIVGRALLLMTIDAKPHGVVHGPLGNRHLRKIAMTHRAIDTRADMRRMIETHVRFFKKSVDALPCQVFAALRVRTKQLNASITVIADGFMTTHADVDARNARTCASFYTGMTFDAFDADFIECMNIVRKLDRLLRFGLDAEKVPRGISETRMRRRENRRTPSLGGIRIRGPARITLNVRLLSAPDRSRENYEQHHRSHASAACSKTRLHCSRKIPLGFKTLGSPLSCFCYLAK